MHAWAVNAEQAPCVESGQGQAASARGGDLQEWSWEVQSYKS